MLKQTLFLVLFCFVAVYAVIRIGEVENCPDCGCPNLVAGDFSDVEYVDGYEDVELFFNVTVFLQTQNWYIAVHSVEPNYTALSVCASVVYSYEGSFEPLMDAERVCIDMDTLYYDVENRKIVDPETESSNILTGTLFFLYNANRENPIVLGCDYCNMSLQMTFKCEPLHSV